MANERQAYFEPCLWWLESVMGLDEDMSKDVWEAGGTSRAEMAEILSVLLKAGDITRENSEYFFRNREIWDKILAAGHYDDILFEDRTFVLQLGTDVGDEMRMDLPRFVPATRYLPPRLRSRGGS